MTSHDDTFTPDGFFRRDPKRTRATFGVEYPSSDAIYKDRKEIPHHRIVAHNRLSFLVERQDFNDVEFSECNFHNRHGKELSAISYLTFSGCRFRRSFMGTTRYTHCRFRRCAFTNCDFAFAQFFECVFEDCEFVDCTGDHCSFERTEVDPDAFMNGLHIPSQNFDGEALQTRAEMLRLLDDIRFRTASSLVRSSIDISNRFYSDAALRHQKREELKYRKSQLLESRRSAKAKRAIGLLWAYVVYYTTSGGTSLLRPTFVTAVIIGIFALLTRDSCISYRDVALDQFNIPHTLLAATSLVLGFGFTNFGACRGLSFAILVAGPCAGIVLLALVGSVIVRRVYR